MVCATLPYFPTLGCEYVAIVNGCTHHGSPVLHMNVLQSVLV